MKKLKNISGATKIPQIIIQKKSINMQIQPNITS